LYVSLLSLQGKNRLATFFSQIFCDKSYNQKSYNYKRKFILAVMKRLLPLLFLLWFNPLSAQNRYDIVIDELMVDPTPQIGLPNNEWIELKNTSAVSLNLQGWRIGDATSLSGPMPNYVLQPDSFVIVCGTSAVGALSVFGSVISVTSFPSLDNDGDQLYLLAVNGKTIHGLNYTSEWYQNDLKKEGGWTLEMMDTNSPCAGLGNWKASVNSTGGSPGRKNSINAVNNDNTAPRLKKAYTIDNSTIILVFDEPVDSATGATVNNYSIDGGISFIDAATLAPVFNAVRLKTNTPLAGNIVYTITTSNIVDCKNNMINQDNSIKTGLPADPVAGDWIINEILFNPRPGAYDYFECYNKSTKVLDAAKLYIANRNSSGAINSIKVLSTTPRYIFPGDYFVVTEDAANLNLNYLVKNPDNVLIVPAMPSFPDDEGDVVLLNFQGAIVDEVKYYDDWHFKLINNQEGVALERIDPEAASGDPGNWHSAGSTAGYGTPTYKNSQYKLLSTINASIEVLPKIFSPDNDGFDDIATVKYRVADPGYVANIIIFDAAGRPVRVLVRNDLLALNGYWNWDGLDDKGEKLPVGVYIIFTEIFNLQGKKEHFKKAIVLARRLN
jgi:BarA-like signal transduction histidine kinase